MKTPEERALLRDALLRALAAAAGVGLNAAALQNAARYAGFTLTEDQLAAEMHYLAEKGYARAAPHATSAGLVRHTLTAAGREYLEATNQI